jgi:hypothetical protein
MAERYVRQEAAALRAALDVLATLLPTLLPMLNEATPDDLIRIARLARLAALGKEIWRAASVLESYEQMQVDGAALVADDPDGEAG